MASHSGGFTAQQLRQTAAARASGSLVSLPPAGTAGDEQVSPAERVATPVTVRGSSTTPRPPSTSRSSRAKGVRRVSGRSTGNSNPGNSNPGRELGDAEAASATEYLRDVPAFCKLSVEALKKVVANLVLHSYEPGESVIKQGEQGTAFYLIKSGSVEFAVQGKGHVGKRGVGECFGELALLSDDNRATASATCSKDGAECYTLQKRQFDLLLKRIMRDERQAKTGRFRYGEIDFEETGNRVPYMIIPNSDEGRDPAKIVEMMVKHLKYKGSLLEKPNIAFGVRGEGQSYLEWAEGVHANSFLAQKWKWKQLLDSSDPPKMIAPNDQYHTDSRGELVKTRWAGQTEDELQEAELRAARDGKLRDQLQATNHEAAKARREAVAQAQAEARAKAVALFEQICRDVGTLHDPARGDVRAWLLASANTAALEEAGLLDRKKLFEAMEVGEEVGEWQQSSEDVSSVEELMEEGALRVSIAEPDLLPNTPVAPKQRLAAEATTPGSDTPSSLPRGVQLSSRRGSTISLDEFLAICQITRRYVLPYRMEELVPLDDALRIYGDKLLAIFQDVVNGVVDSKGWFLFPAGRRPCHQLIGDTIAKYGGSLDDCKMIQYNSLQNPHLVARGKGGTEETGGEYDIDHQSFVEKLQDCSKEILPFSKETPEVDERVVYPSEESLYPSLSNIQGERFQTKSAVRLAALRALHQISSDSKAQRLLYGSGEDGPVIRSDLKQLLLQVGCLVSEGELDEMFRQIGTEFPKQQLEEPSLWNTAPVDSLSTRGLLRCLEPGQAAVQVSRQQFFQKIAQVSADGWQERIEEEERLQIERLETHGEDTETVPISALDWVNKMSGDIGKNDIALHPNSTHLLFWDLPGTRRQGAQMLPWTEIDKFHEYLFDQGVMEGTLVCNGNQSDCNYAISAVARSTPVISLKSAGGSSEFISELFEKRVVGGPHDVGRPVGFAARYPPDAIEPKFRSNVNSLPKESEEREMLVVDVIHTEVGKVLQKQMADMLTMQDSAEEKMIGFLSSERERLSNAWAWSILYIRNSVKEKMLADLLSYLAMLFNFAVVVVIVYKTSKFHWVDSLRPRRRLLQEITSILPANMSLDASAASAWRRLQDEVADTDENNRLEKTELENVLELLLIIIPIMTGLLLTMMKAFSPVQKCNALRWAAYACEKEIYTYRARTSCYSAAPQAIQQWEFDEDEDERLFKAVEQRKAPSKHFVEKMNRISTCVMSEAHLQVSSLQFFEDSDTEQLITEKIEELQGFVGVIATEQTVTQSTLDAARLGLDNVDRQPTEAQIAYVQQNEGRVGMPVLLEVVDNGFGELGAEEYLAVRTKPAISTMKARLPSLSRHKEVLQAGTFFVTGCSVMLATLGAHYDLYIALTTAGVSLLTAVLEYQKLEATIVNLNNSLRGLTQLLMWWNSLSFVERRMVKHKHQLVTMTEQAIMSEMEMVYRNGPDEGSEEREWEEEERSPG